MTENSVMGHSPRVTVIGEALIDLVPNGVPREYRALPGGSPFNVAVGLARLGITTQLMARLADNSLGRILREHAEAEGIDLAVAPHASEPTSLAIVAFDADAKASYDFYLDGAADWQWTPPELARLGADTAVLHFGSIASWIAPGSGLIHATVAACYARGDMLISYDPNIRPLLMGDPAQARATIEANIRCAHIVKASRDDIDWLYPDDSSDHVAAHWHELGALLVVITDGAAGAHVYPASAAPIQWPARLVRVVDTVGAGDAFTAGLLSALVRRGVTHPTALRQMATADRNMATDTAILVAALTCERVGADPPHIGDHPDLQRALADNRDATS